MTLPTWHEVKNIEELREFYLSKLDAIRAAAHECGYAIGAHGSFARDMDLIAVPWVEVVATPNQLAHAIAMAACGIARKGPYDWETKPHGRIATSIPICWGYDHTTPGLGHIDLSVIQ